MVSEVAKGMLRLTIVTAEEFAAEGRLADGHSCLLQGLQQAQRVAGPGEPWAAEILHGYVRAEAEYIARHGVRIE
jgi:hypothetical protein